MRAYTAQDSNGTLRVIGIAPHQIELGEVFSLWEGEEVEITFPDEQTMIMKKRKVE